MSAFAQHFPKYADQLGFDASFAGTAMGVFMLGLSAGRPVLGLLSDKAGAEATAIFALACGVGAVLVLIFRARPCPSLLAVFVFRLFHLSRGGTAGAAAHRDPLRSAGSTVRSTPCSDGYGLAGTAALPGYGFIYDMVNNYIPVLWAICIMLALCAVCVFAAFADKKRQEKTGILEQMDQLKKRRRLFMPLVNSRQLLGDAGRMVTRWERSMWKIWK